MKSHPILLGGLLVAVILLCGCGTTYAPKAGAADPKRVPNFPAGKKVALINAQPSTEPVLVGDAGMGRKVHGDLHVWTENAMTGIRKTLEKKGVTVAPQSEKSLKIAVTKAEFSEAGGGWAFHATIHFTIETSDGHAVQLVADDNSWKFLNACDGAMEKVPLTALTDERVVKFLSDP